MRRIIHPTHSLVLYESPLLAARGVPHAFTTRLGGVSAGPFGSLNLGNPNGCPVQDSYDNIWANYARVAEAIGCGNRRILRTHQVHGCDVAESGDPSQFSFDTRADALLSRDGTTLLSVRVADCVPVLLAGRDGRCVAAVHAGWRGVVGGVLPATLRAMERHGEAKSDVVAAIGPSISGMSFEVGPEVTSEFVRVFGDAAPVLRKPGKKDHIDLRAGLMQQLLAAGVPREAIDVSDQCTFLNAEEFFSHRREAGVTGRMAAVIGVRVVTGNRDFS